MNLSEVCPWAEPSVFWLWLTQNGGQTIIKTLHQLLPMQDCSFAHSTQQKTLQARARDTN